MRYLRIILLTLAVACGSNISKIDLAAKSANIDAAQRGTTLEEKLGVDDRAAIAFLYGADMMGNLDTCG
ncbi:MAG: hypothetical protein RMM17_03195 [Acidobacteriota bacterium]|nr:hypothetical protein [Blastocatellia bacterium]MDW8411675.1 hypothetical protein [Acidobacteriota bacterium]